MNGPPRILPLRLGDTWVAIDAEAVGAAVPCPALAPLPNTKPHVLGATLHGQSVLLVLDLRRLLLDRDQDQGLPPLLLPLANEVEGVGLGVDEVGDIVQGAEPMPANRRPSGKHMPRLCGQWVRRGKQAWPLISLPRLLAISPRAQD